MRVTPQELLAQLPPSDRDFRVFEAVVVYRGTTRDVAERFKISQTRVCQILDKVWDWHDQVLPHQKGQTPPEHRQYAAQLLAADRLDSLYAQSMECFRESRGVQMKHRESDSGKCTTTTRSCGDPRYLFAAMRIALAHGKSCDPRGLLMTSRALAADVADARGLDTADLEPAAERDELANAGERVVAQQEARESSPVGDCSETDAGRSNGAQPAASRSSAKPTQPTTWKRPNRKQRRAREAFLSPVQQPTRRDKSAAVAHLKLSPDQPGASLAVG